MEINIKKRREEFEEDHHSIETSDGIILFLRAWMPNKKSNVAILILHGITAYSGPYDLIGSQLSSVGYAVYGLDLRGHGLSDGIRGDYPSKERLILDLGETIDFIKNRHEKLILLGHSLGVITAIVALTNYKEKIDGLILLSAARTTRPGVYPKMQFTKKLKILFSSILKPNKAVISYQREGMLGLDDPLFNFKYTLRFMKILSAKNIDFPQNLNIPILHGIGENDELFSVESARNFFEEIPNNNKKFIILPGAKHAVFPDGSWAEIIEWLVSNFKIT
jgi:alpha-beta hydrolase superfamily lysophospholipase